LSAARHRISPGRVIMLLAGSGLGAGGAVAAQPAPVSPDALHACAIISADAQRLACYDQLAGRGKGAVTAAAAPAATRPGAAPATASAHPVASAATPPEQSFGLYSVEHPTPTAPAVASSLDARVVALGKSASGHMTVSLAGGAIWEITEPDPLLAVGDSVTIKRAGLGSFLMTTPSKRTHRARRLE
jgi:hypothetical protein